MRSGKNIVEEQDLVKIVIDDILWANNRLASCRTIKSWSWMFAHVQRLIPNQTETGRVPIWIEMFPNSEQKWQTGLCILWMKVLCFGFIVSLDWCVLCLMVVYKLMNFCCRMVLVVWLDFFSIMMIISACLKFLMKIKWIWWVQKFNIFSIHFKA